MFQKLIVGAVLAACWVLSANAQSDARGMPTSNSVKLSLTQAVQTAETQGNGKAISVEFDSKGSEYEVEVLSFEDKPVKYKLQ